MALFDNVDWLSLLKGGANLGLIEKGIRDVQSEGEAMQTGLSNLSTNLRSDLQFKPYTVTSATGSFGATPTGATSTLSPELQMMMQKLQEGAGMFYNRTLAPIDQRASALTAEMENALAPSRERERLALEERLLGQGRLGVNTAAYGGTPEQLALAKAFEEQRSMNALNARGQAMGEQLQNYNIGQSMFGLSFVPNQQNMIAATTATPFAELATRAQQQSAVTGAELGAAGLNAGVNAQQQKNALRQIQLQGLSDLAFGSQSTGAGLLSSIFGSKDPTATSNSAQAFLDLMIKNGARF